MVCNIKTMLNKQIIFFLLACAAIIGVGFWFVFRHRASGSSAVQSAQISSSGSGSTTVDIRFGQIKITAEVADTIWKKIKGLGGRESLGENAGMLFPYGSPGFYGFWMRGMKFPIDIIWIGADKKVADITKNIPPESFPKTFAPKNAAQYVLEVPAGFADKRGIKAGDAVSF